MMMGKLTAKANAGITGRINTITWKIDRIAGRTESIVAQVIVVVGTALKIDMIVERTKGIDMSIEGIVGISGVSIRFDFSMVSWTGGNKRYDLFTNLKNSY